MICLLYAVCVCGTWLISWLRILRPAQEKTDSQLFPAVSSGYNTRDLVLFFFSLLPCVDFLSRRDHIISRLQACGRCKEIRVCRNGSGALPHPTTVCIFTTCSVVSVYTVSSVGRGDSSVIDGCRLRRCVSVRVGLWMSVRAQLVPGTIYTGVYI